MSRLLDRAEHDLVELVRVGQQLVVVDLHDERDLVRVLAGHQPEHAEGRGHGVAAALDRELHDVLGSK
jgi:bifunctional DNA-binding transcriptional regulator/antitoxin component of YhaV-PrlF toxin-antitoxin module